MARIRSVHPDICESETIEALDDPDLEVTFTRLWTHCDDHGRCVDNLLLIKAAIYPLRQRVTPVVLDRWLNSLARAGLIKRYEAAGKRYIAVRSWGEYQHPNRPKPSKYPEPPERVGPPPDDTDSAPSKDGQCAVTAVSVDGHQRVTPGEGVGEGEGGGEGTRAPGRPGTLALVPSNGSPPPVAGRRRHLDYAVDFEAWWVLYPRKEAKAAAAKAYRTALGHADQRTISDGLARSIEAWQREGRKVDKIPHAASWLNGRRWEDDHTAPAATRPRPRSADALDRVLGGGS